MRTFDECLQELRKIGEIGPIKHTAEDGTTVEIRHYPFIVTVLLIELDEFGWMIASHKAFCPELMQMKVDHGKEHEKWYHSLKGKNVR